MNPTGRPLSWLLFDGQQWLIINNNDVIEAAYRQPGAKGIRINTHLGSLYIDFDGMTVAGTFPGLQVQRRMFQHQGQPEDMGWYYKDTSCWCEYGIDIPDALVNSQVMENWYQSNPGGTFSFTVGMNSYTIDFSAMVQINTSTLNRRTVRRRPKSVRPPSLRQSGVTPAARPTGIQRAATPPPFNPAPTDALWEFMDDEGIWKEYRNPDCSLNSLEIERRFQLNPSSSIRFTAGFNSYILDFRAMQQTNDYYGTRRSVRRTMGGTQPGGTPAPARWQYFDQRWKDYVQGEELGQCTISSDDIENQYQLNRTGTMTFSSSMFTYNINFSVMKQVNTATGTQRNIRRLDN